MGKLKEEKQPSMCHKAGSRLPVLRMNLQDFSGLINEFPDWTDQSDKSLLCYGKMQGCYWFRRFLCYPRRHQCLNFSNFLQDSRKLKNSPQKKNPLILFR